MAHFVPHCCQRQNRSLYGRALSPENQDGNNASPGRHIAPLPQADSLHSYKYDSLHIEAVDIQRGVYRLSGESDYFAAPAQAVHKFEIIQYANSTGDIF